MIWSWISVSLRSRMSATFTRSLLRCRLRLRFRGATQQLESPALVKSLRRDIARLNTILRERELSNG
jgi:ribosomal protein L29